MSAKSNKIQLRRVLPWALVSPQAGDHLYMIGCAYYRRDESTTRYRFHSPIFFLSIILFVFIKSFIIMLLPPQYDDYMIWFGDVSLILKLRIHFNILLLSFDYIVFFLHILHYQVYRKYRKYGIRPNCAPFDLAAGLVSPRSVGLHDSHKVAIFGQFCKWSLSTCLFVTRYLMNVSCWSAYFMAFVLKMVTMDNYVIWFVCFGHSLIWALKSHIFFTYFFFHMLYFFIICFYLRLKMDIILSAMNNLMKNNSLKQEKVNSTLILVLLSSFKSVFNEISQFDSTFWSQFIFCVWSSYTINISLFIYSAIFGKVDLSIRSIMWVVAIVEIVLIVSLCWIASSVNKKAKVMYLAQNSLLLRSKAINLKTRYKFFTCIETWSSYRIGFSCWGLFPMTYFTFYEMIAMAVIMFLKLIKM